MSPTQAAMEHWRLNADLDAPRAYGNGWWTQETLGGSHRFVEERYEP